MTRRTACPEVGAWQQFSAGAGSVDAASLAEHLAHCDHCLPSVHTLHLHDSLIGALAAAGPADHPHAATLALLVQRLQSLHQTSLAGDVDLLAPASLRPAPEGKPAPAQGLGLDLLAAAEGPDELGRLGGYR